MAKKKSKDTIEEDALEIALESIRKHHGLGSILVGGESIPGIQRLSSGCYGIDRVLGGGYPRGRIVEVMGPESSGKTTLTLHAIAEAQKNGETAAFIDAEHSLDIYYAANLGVDTDKLLISQPDCGEQALNIVETLVSSGAVSIIVVDSVAALTPRKEIEGEMGDSHMGLQARLMSQALRKLARPVANSNCLLIFINQIRMKIGVMFGCLHYDTLVNFTNGESIPIGTVVNNKIEGDVYCLDPDTGAIRTQPIIAWHNNGKVETPKDFIHIQTTSIDGRGRFGLTCTPEHKILTNSGWKEAKNLSFQDKLISKYMKTITGSYEMFMRGIIVGDSHISIKDKNTACLRFQDNQNVEYLNWKIDKLSPYLQFTERKISRGFRYDSNYTYELAKLKKDILNRDPMYLLDNIHPMGLAIWIMDDGHLDLSNSHKRYSISVKRFKNNESKLQQITDKLSELGYNCTFRLQDGSINFSTDISDKIANYIAEWVPPCMEHKLPWKYRNCYKEFLLSYNEHYVTEEVDIKEIRSASPRQMRDRRKFDISVERDQNYMVGGINNGIFVHNSPETTTGGNALKFYASQRIDIRRTGGIKANIEGKEIFIANTTRIKVTKNKVSPPFRECEVLIRFGTGIDEVQNIIASAVKQGIVEKKGAWFNYKDERIGHGEENTCKFLRNRPDLLEKIASSLKGTN